DADRGADVGVAEAEPFLGRGRPRERGERGERGDDRGDTNEAIHRFPPFRLNDRDGSGGAAAAPPARCRGRSGPARADSRDRAVSLDVGRAEAELAEVVRAPGVEQAVRADRERVTFAGGDELPGAAECLHELVAVVVARLGNAEPAAGVGAGRPEEAVGVEREGEPAAGRDGDPVHRGADLLRARRLDGPAQPELAADVAAPGPQGAVVLDGEGEVVARRDGDPVAVGADSLERRVLVAGDPELAVPVVAGDPERAVRLQRDAVRVPAGDGDPVLVGADAGRRVPVGRIAVTELAVVVAAPGPERAVFRDGERVSVFGFDPGTGLLSRYEVSFPGPLYPAYQSMRATRFEESGACSTPGTAGSRTEPSIRG